MPVYIQKIKLIYQSINDILTIKEYWATFAPNLKTRFFPGMQFLQKVKRP